METSIHSTYLFGPSPSRARLPSDSRSLPPSSVARHSCVSHSHKPDGDAWRETRLSTELWEGSSEARPSRNFAWSASCLLSMGTWPWHPFGKKLMTFEGYEGGNEKRNACVLSMCCMHEMVSTGVFRLPPPPRSPRGWVLNCGREAQKLDQAETLHGQLLAVEYWIVGGKLRS